MSPDRSKKIAALLAVISSLRWSRLADPAVTWVVSGKLVQAVAQVGSIFAIGIFLTPIEQGLYYTFLSLMALQVFFELGMSNVVVQYLGHAVARLTLEQRATLEYDNDEKLMQLLSFFVRWYAVAFFLFIGAVGFGGLLYFGRMQDATLPKDWEWAWCCGVVATAFQLLLQGAASVFEGLGKVTAAFKARAMMSIALSLGTMLSICAGAALYSISIGIILSVVAGLMAAPTLNWKRVLAGAKKTLTISTAGLWQEIFPFFWKIALSWASGYLVFQFTTPVLFAGLGPVAAGQYGMCQQVVSGLSVISMAWANTKQTRWAGFASLHQGTELNAEYRATLRKTVGVNLLLSLCAILGVEFLHLMDWQLSSRFASVSVMGFMLFRGIIGQFTYTQAVYLRAHKVEPFLIVSLLSALLLGCSSVLLAHHGIETVTISQLAIAVLMSLIGVRIFSHHRKEWYGC